MWRAVPLIYFVETREATHRVKIGFTRTPLDRMVAIMASGPLECLPIAFEVGVRSHERKLHSRFAKYRVIGEWFTWADDISAYINTLPYRCVGGGEFGRDDWRSVLNACLSRNKHAAYTPYRRNPFTDKRNRVAAILGNPLSRQRTNTDIARECGCSTKLVRDMRREAWTPEAQAEYIRTSLGITERC